MKLLLIAHGYPPELVGGTEKNVQGLAEGLLARGHEVVVVAGSMQYEDGFRVSEAELNGVRVIRIHRADVFFDHWQKSHAHDVSAAFRDVLAQEQPDLVHVHHWIRLSDDLVLNAARAGIPACVTLHDLWTSCLVTFRVRPDTHEFCEEQLASSPCLSCAANVPPRTPWIDKLGQTTLLHERKHALVRELRLARGVIAPTTAHALALGRYLGVGADDVNLRVIPHGRDLTPEQLGFTTRDQLASPSGTGQLVLGAWGHLHPLKGADLLIEAVRRAGAGVRLHLSGAPVIADYAEQLKRGAEGLDVHFHPAFDVAELGRLPVSDVHAFVSGSRAHESWGLVVDEARALDLPMILPRAGAFPERLQEGSGARFYTQGDADDLARVFRELRDQPGALERVRADAPPLTSVVPTLGDQLDALEVLYTEAISQGAPSAPPLEWFEARLAEQRRDAWGESLSRRTGAELGFEG